MMLIPWEECLQCGKTLPPAELQSSGGMCPACGGASFKQSDTQGDEIPKGRGVTDACSPFEIAPCPGHTRWEEVPYIYRLRWRTKNYVEQHHPELAKKLNWEQMPKERSLQFLRSLPAQTDIGSMPIGSGSMGASLGHSEGISEYELWVKPSEAYPEGLVARFMGEGGEARVVVDESQGLPGPLPYTTAQGEKSWQFVHVPYKLISGRLWAAGPVDSIIQKQDQVNQLDALVQLTLQRTANPVWLEPEGSNIKHLTGVPGLIVRYTPSAAFDSKPERIDGKFLPTAVIQLRDQYLKDIESLTGTFDIIKGQRPTNVQAFSAMQLLVERSQSRFTVPLKNRGEAYRQLLTLQLELERQFGPTKRSAMINWPHEQTSYLDFTNADLQGDITVLIEDGSQSPKTNLGKRAAIDQLKNLGLLNIQDPQQTYQVFQIFGATDLVPAMDGATREAIFEMELFERFADQFKLRDEQQNNGRLIGVKPPPLQPTAMSPTPLLDANGFPVPPMSPQPIVELPFMVEPWQQHPLHLAHHAMWAQGDSARSIFEEYPVLKAAFLSHWLDHQARQQAAMMPQAIGPGGEGRVAGDGQALSSSNRESGDPGDVPRGAGPGARA
jgi:hypothetical protein